MSRTLAIIKPDAVRAGRVGAVLSLIERNELRVVEMRMLTLTFEEAKRFYGEHRNKHFFDDLTAFMASGPCVVLVLEHAMAQSVWRSVMSGLRRAHAGKHAWENAVHGSDSIESAAREISFFDRLLHASSE